MTGSGPTIQKNADGVIVGGVSVRLACECMRARRPADPVGDVLWYEGEYDVITSEEATALTAEHIRSERHAEVIGLVARGARRRGAKELLRESLKRMPPPFQGEEMTCIVCGSVENSEAQTSKGWRCIELNSTDRYYVCPKELPDDRAPAAVRSDAFVSWFRSIVAKTPSYKPASSVLYWRESEGQVMNEHLN